MKSGEKNSKKLGKSFQKKLEGIDLVGVWLTGEEIEEMRKEQEDEI